MTDRGNQYYLGALFCFLQLSSNCWALGRAPSVEHLLGYCGELGTLSERLSECEKPKYEGGVGELYRRVVLGADKKSHAWRLAAKALQGPEVWLDEEAGVFWSDPFEGSLNVSQATTICADEDQNGDVTVGVPLQFRLPDAQDYEVAEIHGIRAAIPGFEHAAIYWTQTWGATSVYMAYFSRRGKLKGEPKNAKHRVRCIARQARQL